jgi:hypothetical protein
MFHIAISGNNNSYLENRDVRLEGHRCNGSCIEVVVDREEEGYIRYWSNAADWTNATAPTEGANVEVQSGWNMVYDLEEPSPILEMLTINGRLTFTNDTDHHLRAKHIFVRAGELHIGSELYPYQHNAKITLFGLKE